MRISRLWDLVEILIALVALLFLYMRLKEEYDYRLYAVLLMLGVLIIVRCLRTLGSTSGSRRK